MPVLVFDLIIALVLLITALLGYKKGFVLTLCGFLAVFVAFLGATFLSNLMAEPVGRAIQPVLEQHITTFLQEKAQDNGLDYTVSVPSSPSSPFDLPGETQQEFQIPLSDALDLLRQSALYRAAADAIQDAVNDGLMDATASAASAIAAYFAQEVARMVLFLVSFLLVLAAWTLLSHALDLAFRLPVLSTLNHWSGAALGLVKGGLLVFIALWLLQGWLPAQEEIQRTVLLQFFTTNSPLSLFLQIFS